MQRDDELWLIDDPEIDGSLEAMSEVQPQREHDDGELGLRWSLGDVWRGEPPPLHRGRRARTART